MPNHVAEDDPDRGIGEWQELQAELSNSGYADHKRGRLVPAGSVGPNPRGGELRKVTPEPVSLHGDFPENCGAALLAYYSARKRRYALTQASYPPCGDWKPALGSGTPHRAGSGP